MQTEDEYRRQLRASGMSDAAIEGNVAFAKELDSPYLREPSSAVADLADVPADFTGRVRHFENGKPVFVAWYSEGLLHNPARHHPAYRLFRPDGRVKFEMYYTHGLLHDASPKHPAVKGFYANGAVHYEERYFGGKRNDGRDGSPAIRKWRLDGTLRHELRYREGKRLD